MESIAYQVKDLIDAMEKDAGAPLQCLRVDGGASVNRFLMQFQSDLLSLEVKRPTVTEATAFGAALLAGLAVGYWKDMDDVKENWKLERTFEPNMADDMRTSNIDGWHEAVKRSAAWAK